MGADLMNHRIGVTEDKTRHLTISPMFIVQMKCKTLAMSVRTAASGSGRYVDMDIEQNSRLKCMKTQIYCDQP